MSFEDTGIKPKLVEPKMIEKVMRYQQSQVSIGKKIGKSIGKICYDNLFGIIIFLAIVILLINRYKDVQEKKKKKHNFSKK